MSEIYEKALNFIENYKINLIDVIFIGFTVVIVIFGSLMSLMESYLPNSIRQSFRYGKHAFKGTTDPLVNCLEVPKSWFKHFYIFAFCWSISALFLILKGFVLEDKAPEVVLKFLDLMAGGRKRQAYIDSSTALIAAVLMTMQCGRRFYETNFVQIFSKKSKMNLSHYMVGHLHYFGTILLLLANTEGFVRGTQPSTFSISKITFLQYLCICAFHLSWTQQYKSNMILVNLRKDSKTGKVLAAEKHFMPRGGFFELISSPHMFFEIVIYITLWGLLYENISFVYVVTWVVSNQIVNALLTHQWYRKNFKNYPKNRHAIIPFLL